MSKNELKKIADDADMIIAGYSFVKDENGFIKVINLKNTKEACLLQEDGEMIETSMNDITVIKVQNYYLKNKEFMENVNA